MQVGEFITTFREIVQDKQAPPFWSDERIVSYLNEAVQEACERARLIEDRSMTLDLEPGQDTYRMHASVFEIKRLSLRGRPLDETSVEELDCDSPGWETRTGQPRCFVFEPASGGQPARVRLVPTPAGADTVSLTVYRGAKQALASGDRSDRTAQPEIPLRFHTRLMDWVMHRAYLQQDADTFDPAKAATSLALFVQAFGERPDANVQRKHSDRRPPIVHCSW